MSTSRAIKPKRDETFLSNWESMPERAPSIEQADKPIVARFLAMIGLFLLVLGILGVTYPLWRQGVPLIGFGWSFLAGSLGLCMILFHVYSERDQQFRRLYAFLALALMLAGVVLRVVAFKPANMQWYLIIGLPGLSVGLIMLIGVIRNETEAGFRSLLVNIVGALGALMIAFSVVWGLRFNDFLAGEGALLMLLGLCYAGAFIGLHDNPEHAYFAGLLLGGVGVIGFIAGLTRSLWPGETSFMVPSGMVLMGMSLVYVLTALGVCVDWPIVVLTRRELGHFFYSPLAYLVLIGQLILCAIMFFMFVQNLDEASQRGGMLEPIVGQYIFTIIPVIVQMFFVPVLTMRLLSEERRTGTLEVLLTAPVNEVSVVLGKFFACWAFYMLTWLPCSVFLISLRYVGDAEFDYRPMLSFTAAMAAISAGLVAMGLFMSSLTSNQIIAAVFTFVGVNMHLAFYIAKFWPRLGFLEDFLTYVNYLDFMLESLQGMITPRFFIFHASVAVVFLFATVKVLEARKWA